MIKIVPTKYMYGKCPTCGEQGKTRERRIDGDTICVNGHKHKSLEFDNNV